MRRRRHCAGVRVEIGGDLGAGQDASVTRPMSGMLLGGGRLPLWRSPRRSTAMLLPSSRATMSAVVPPQMTLPAGKRAMATGRGRFSRRYGGPVSKRRTREWRKK